MDSSKAIHILQKFQGVVPPALHRLVRRRRPTPSRCRNVSKYLSLPAIAPVWVRVMLRATSERPVLIITMGTFLSRAAHAKSRSAAGSPTDSRYMPMAVALWRASVNFAPKSKDQMNFPVLSAAADPGWWYRADRCRNARLRILRQQQIS